MAKDKAPAEETENNEGAEKPKKSGSLMLIIIIIVLVLVILVGAIVGILMMGGESSDKKPEQQKTEQPATDQKEKEKAPASTSEDSRPLDKIGILYPLDTFTVNLLSDSGTHYLKAQLSLELSAKEMAEELETKKPVIRDKIIRILSSKSVDEVSTVKGKDKLSAQIMGELNSMLKDGSINGIYFTDFVIQ